MNKRRVPNMTDFLKKQQDTNPKMEKENFQFFIPDHITKCEREALLKFFQEYFAALIESKKFEGDEIIRRKRIIVNALNEFYKDHKKHHDMYTKVLLELKNYYCK